MFFSTACHDCILLCNWIFDYAPPKINHRLFYLLKLFVILFTLLGPSPDAPGHCVWYLSIRNKIRSCFPRGRSIFMASRSLLPGCQPCQDLWCSCVISHLTILGILLQEWWSFAQHTSYALHVCLFCSGAIGNPAGPDLLWWSSGFDNRFGDMWDTPGSAKKALQTKR